MNINLHIERLVLDGIHIAPCQRRLLQANVTTELTRLLGSDGLAGNLVEGAALSRMSTRAIQLTNSKPEQLGQQIARSVYGGIGRE